MATVLTVVLAQYIPSEMLTLSKWENATPPPETAMNARTMA
jgi:hypothetical protein